MLMYSGTTIPSGITMDITNLAGGLALVPQFSALNPSRFINAETPHKLVSQKNA